MKTDDTEISEDRNTAIPFTAKLIAYYRSQETKRKDALLIDELADLFVKDLEEYIEQHKRIAGTGDYAIIRSVFIENELLEPWCTEKKESQIVLLGAGLDTRTYRFEPLRANTHTIYEVDLPMIQRYKEKVLKDIDPLCALVRVSTDLSNPLWVDDLRTAGFRSSLPTFWILEGVAYYLQKHDALTLFQQISCLGAHESRMFVDLCVPAISEMNFGPFASHFEWGIAFDDIRDLFLSVGWDVSPSYADDHDQGRDVGQKGMIFVYGCLSKSTEPDEISNARMIESHLPIHELAREMVPEIRCSIELICSNLQQNPAWGVDQFVEFIRGIKPRIEHIIQSFNDPISVGHISPRLLGNPLSILSDSDRRTIEEIEAHIVGYLSAIFLLVYMVSNKLGFTSFRESYLYSKLAKIQRSGKVSELLDLVSREFD